MSSQQIVLFQSAFDGTNNAFNEGEGTVLDEYCAMSKYFGDSALDVHGRAVSFYPFKEDILAGITLPISEVVLVKKDSVLYLTCDQQLYVAWRNADGSIRSNELICESVKTVGVTRSSKSRVAILTTCGQIKLTSIKGHTFEECRVVNNILKDAVSKTASSIQPIIFGPIEFVALHNPNHQVLLYLIDPHLRLKLMSTLEKVLAIAEYDGKLYFLKEDRNIYEWGAEGRLLYDDNLLVMNKYGITLISDPSSNGYTEDGSYRYFTLLEYVKSLEGKEHFYLEIA